MSPYECSVNPGPQISYLWRHNVPTWTGTLCIWDDSYMGPEVPEDSYPSNTNTDSLPLYLFFIQIVCVRGPPRKAGPTLKTSDQVYIFKFVRKEQNMKILNSNKSSDCMVKQKLWLDMTADINKVRTLILITVATWIRLDKKLPVSTFQDLNPF